MDNDKLVVNYNGEDYLAIQASGNAARFALPYYAEFCKGIGYDIGCNRLEWNMPGSIPIDPLLDDRYHAMNLPENVFGKVDFIFSSHCLEHVTDPWYNVLKYWTSQLNDGGVMLLYLPSYEQEYWRPWNNNKHHHILDPTQIKDSLDHLGYKKIFVSGVDLNKSFFVLGLLTDKIE